MERERELALVSRLRAGEVTAVDEIFSAFNDRLLSFLTRMAKNRSIAWDLSEETWLRLVSCGQTLCADTQLGPWLFTVAPNLYFRHCRNRAREQFYTADYCLLWPGGLAQSPFDLARLNRFEHCMTAALALVPAKYREVLLLVAVEGLRPADPAKVCGISPDALGQRLSRARQSLSRIMADQEPFTETVCQKVSP